MPRKARTLKNLHNALNSMNRKYPRPKMRPPVFCEPYDLDKSFANYFPGYDRSGVYALLDKNKTVRYIGKSSTNLGRRLGSYFKRSDDRRKGIARHAELKRIRYIVTAPMPKNHFFEASAIEEFLIRKLNPPLNKRGKFE